MLKIVKVRSYEQGLYFRDGEFQGLLGAGRYWYVDPLGKVDVEVVSQRAPWLVHEKLDMIVKSGALAERAVVLDLKDRQRALVWIDGRFSHVLPPGLYAYWTTYREVRVEVIDVQRAGFEHADLPVIVQSQAADRVLDSHAVEKDHMGVLFEDGKYVQPLAPGRYAFWKNAAKVTLVPVDMRETMLDVGGQEIMTVDKVTLRMNAVVTYRVTDAKKAAEANLIVRREETAAMRSQANTAKLLEGNQTLMRLRELEVLEKVAGSGKLNVVIGEKGLTERIVNLL